MKKREITTTELFEAIGTFSEEMTRQFASVHTEMGTMRSDIHELKADVSAIKSDVNTLKSDVHGLKSDVNTLKSDVHGLKSGLKTVQKEMATKEDIKSLMVHGDLRLNMLIGKLVEENILAPAKVADILRFRPAGT